MKETRIKAGDLALIALMAAVICICSWISVPMTIPFTMQTFGVFSAVLLLGGRRGTAAIALYILLGIVGVPVFSGFRGGIGHILGPTGGYIVGFLFMGAVYAVGETHVGRTGKISLLAAGLLVCYLVGTFWFMAANAGGQGFLSVAAICVLPYIIPDLMKLLLADMISNKIRRYGVV